VIIAQISNKEALFKTCDMLLRSLILRKWRRAGSSSLEIHLLHTSNKVEEAQQNIPTIVSSEFVKMNFRDQEREFRVLKSPQKPLNLS
jgi:hypothetical protein